MSAKVTPVAQDPVPAQPVGVQIGREQELRQPVPGEVAQRHPAAVVVVAIGEDVQFAGIDEAVLEADAGIAGWELGEEAAVCRRCLVRETLRGSPVRAGAAGHEVRRGKQGPP
jgi:hypothetical protein